MTHLKSSSIKYDYRIKENIHWMEKNRPGRYTSRALANELTKN
jgi:hypothetical protein